MKYYIRDIKLGGVYIGNRLFSFDFSNKLAMNLETVELIIDSFSKETQPRLAIKPRRGNNE